MEVSMLEQLFIFLESVLIGAFLGVVYDFVRSVKTCLGVPYTTKLTEKLKGIRFKYIRNPLVKKPSGFNGVITFISDIIYFLIATLVLMVFLYYKNNGIVRWYVFLGAIIGMLIYYVSIGKLIGMGIEVLFFFARVVCYHILSLLARPFQLLSSKIKPIFRAMCIKAKEVTAKRKRKPKKRREPHQLMRSGRP